MMDKIPFDTMGTNHAIYCRYLLLMDKINNKLFSVEQLERKGGQEVASFILS